jgi:hypothetical protein
MTIKTSGVARRRRVVWLYRAAKSGKVHVLNDKKKYFLLSTNFKLT